VSVLYLLMGVGAVLLISVGTGYFVAQEFSYMAVDRSQLAARAEDGEMRARLALGVTRRTSFMLSGAQLGITITALVAGYVAEPLIGDSLSTILGGVGVPEAVSITIAFVMALVVATILQMIIGELFPKNLAIARPEPVALWLAGSTTLFLKLFGWLIWFFDQSSNLVLRLLRIEPVHDVEHAATARDLERIIADSRERGQLSDDLAVMIDRILDFPTEDVEHAMVPRARVAVVSDEDTLGEVRGLMKSGHSRYPVLEEDTDQILGVVHLADVLEMDMPADTPVTEIMRPALVVSNLTVLPEALRELEASSNQLACVVDEYGGFSGVLTLEDLAEELVGEIADEHDEAADQPSPPINTADGWLIGGDAHVDEVERSLRITLPEGDYETIAGLIIAHHGGLPDQGETVRVELPLDPATLIDEDDTPRALLFQVVTIGNYVPAKVRVTAEGPS
jgi:CBS domain containing-hemolysin-like protein